MARAITFFLLLLFFSPTLMAQLDPVKWSFAAEKINKKEYNLILTAASEDGWFIYSQFLESEDGPVKTNFVFDQNPAFELVGAASEEGKKKEGFDELFGMNLIKFSGTTKFVQRIKLLDKIDAISGYLEFMCCDDSKCLPPKEVTFEINLPK